MLTEYLFVSCDVVAHSAEPSVEIQVARVEGINRAIGDILGRYEGENLVWASGGDGGHVAIPAGQKAPEIALELIRTLRQWSIDEAVPLRVCGSVGQAQVVRGADARAQLAGPGINTAGRLLPYGGQRRVVVTEAFKDAVKGQAAAMFQFHHCVRLEPKNSPPLVAWLLSSDGQFDSTWEEPASTTDAALLALAARSGQALEVIYRARRLLELNTSDARAIQALRSLGNMTFRGKRNFLHKLLQDEHIGAELIRLGNLLERRSGETVCSAGEGGTSMFLVLRGRLQVFFASDAALGDAHRQESVVMVPGDLGGELAFALRRNRTATLQCLEDAALLSFTHEELLHSFASSADSAGLQRALSTEILAKVLENFCNTAPFFRTVWPLLSEPNSLAPWTSLLPHSEVVNISADKLRIDFPLSAGVEEVVFLVSGSLRAEGPSSTWTGEGYPLVHAHLAPRVLAPPTHMLLREDCKVLRVKREGLLRLGPDAFEQICEQAAATLTSLVEREKPPTRSARNSRTDIVFISYCRDNQLEVASLRDRLMAAGESVWWDQDILPGADWKLEIRRAISRSYAVICCLSPELASRSRSGVYPELSEAMRAMRERPPGDIFLVPVRLAECVVPQVEIDDGRMLDRLQTLDLFPASDFESRFARLVAALREAKA
ncbi:TIR domain-containing protein [Piscinibacter sp. XHJ-5]|uniref:TIR domain-containing protein n=1 Tax=Piscinibacter sp. XHJ-5 TaxID=3037797 RepID=UPI002453452A|nr:TIR domain-containing protein [Piscinibacter sp. XHJ-5]